MCSLTSTQLADLLNYLLASRSLNRLIVESWETRFTRLPVERWCQRVLEEFEVVPKVAGMTGKSHSLILPEALEYFASVSLRIDLIEREKRRGRKAA